MIELFKDETLKERIQIKLPKLFQIASIENTRGGKEAMEVGSMREKIIVALLIYKFGEENIDSDIGVTTHANDVKVYGEPVSIKTKTSKYINGFKLSWTVDAAKSKNFLYEYKPSYDILYAQINWGSIGGLYYFPLNAQLDVLNSIGRDTYIKLPKKGTNPRGIEITTKAARELVKHKDTLTISITWKKESIDYKPITRWVELWKEEI